MFSPSSSSSEGMSSYSPAKTRSCHESVGIHIKAYSACDIYRSAHSVILALLKSCTSPRTRYAHVNELRKCFRRHRVTCCTSEYS